MTQEEKEILLKDLCARVPYGVIINIPHIYPHELKAYLKAVNPEREIIYYEICGSSSPLFDRSILGIKPYLRPMSSMTEDEYAEWTSITEVTHLDNGWEVPCMPSIDWLNSHHFDYRGLIECGLALEAPEGIYKI